MSPHNGIAENEVPFRGGVGMVVINDEGLVLSGQRKDLPGAWQAPQGGLGPDEEPIDAVRRELTEETGILWAHVTVLDECAEWLGYELPAEERSEKTGRGQVQKWFLLHYHGTAEISPPLGDAAEFDQWRWMPLPELAGIAWQPRQPIYHRLAQCWGNRIAADSSRSSTGPRWWSRIVAWLTTGLRHFDDERFRSAVDRYEAERSRHASVHGASKLRFADQQARVAENRWDRGEEEAAWTALKAAYRDLIELLDESDLRLEQERVLQEGKEKLTGWRRATIEQSLGPLHRSRRLQSENKTTQPEASRDVLIQAVKATRRIIDDHMDNEYLRMRLLSGHLLRSCVVLTIVLLVVGWVVSSAWRSGWSPGPGQGPFTDGWTLVVVAALGALGAATSGVVRFMSRDAEWKLPQLRAERVLILMRPFVGVAAALIVITLLDAGIGGLRLSPDAALAIALVSGFSEALVGRAVAQASKSIVS